MSLPADQTPELLDRESALLPKDAPARVARWSAWLLLLLSIVIAIFAVAFKLPETVVAPFELVPSDGADPVQASIAGELAGVFVREGQSIRAGQELFRIRSDGIRNAHSQRGQLQEERRALGDRSIRLDEAHVAELAIKDAEIVQAERELVFRAKHLALSRDILRRSQPLLSQGSISEVELLNHELAAAESEKDHILTEKLLQQIQLQRREKVTARRRQQGDEQADLEKIRLQLAALDEQLADSNGDLKSIRAAFDAVVIHVEHNTLGGVVPAGAVLCQVARASSKPMARLFLPETGVGKIAVGQNVRLFFSAFPYQRHGTISATINWISPTPVTAAERAGFVALLDLAEADVARLPLLIGMQGEARILVGRRTLLERAVEPLRAMRERVNWDQPKPLTKLTTRR